MTTEVLGYEEAIEALRGIDIAMRARIIRAAIRGVTKAAAADMTQAAPVRRERSRDGATYRQRLRQRLGDVLRTYRSGATWWAAAGEQRYSRGQRHAHLVEFGHRIVRGGTIPITSTYTTRGGVVKTRTYTRKAKKEENRGKGQILGNTTPKPFMRAVIDKYKAISPELLRESLAEQITAHVRGGGNG
jgi:hypothetical protein